MKFNSLLVLTLFFTTPLFGAPLKESFNQIKNNTSKNLMKDYLYRNVNDEYIIDSGDVLKISVSRDYKELNSNSIINGEGKIMLPFLGHIYVKGLTIEELKVLLDKAYSEYVKYPNVEVQVINYRALTVFVNGEVHQPGFYELSGSMQLKNNNLDENKEDIFIPQHYFPNVFDAIRTAGGVTLYTDLSKVKLIRKNSISAGGGKKMALLNFNNDMKNIDQSQNIRIYDGDEIHLEKNSEPDKDNIKMAIRSNLNPRFLRIYVTGRVIEPGIKNIGNKTTLNDAIDISGGAKVLRGPVNYITYNNGEYEKKILRYRKNASRGSKNNPYLKDGDLISVGSSFFSSASEVITEVTAPFQGLYSTYRLIELISEE